MDGFYQEVLELSDKHPKESMLRIAFYEMWKSEIRTAAVRGRRAITIEAITIQTEEVRARFTDELEAAGFIVVVWPTSPKRIEVQW